MLRLGFLGAGKMATAIAGGIVRTGILKAEEIAATDIVPQAREKFAEAIPGVHMLAGNEELVRQCSAIILAVKPQDAPSVLRPLTHLFQDRLLISIAAGIRLADLKKLTQCPRIIRVMPNTPALVGEGASVFCCSPEVSREERKFAEQIFNAVGWCCEMDEDKLDAVTALSGSGPAFLFRYVEAMTAAGASLGLPAGIAQQLTIQTIAGAVAMLRQGIGTPAELRQAVTSKRGTTEAGLNALSAADFEGVISKCLTAAAERSRQLGEEFSHSICE